VLEDGGAQVRRTSAHHVQDVPVTGAGASAAQYFVGEAAEDEEHDRERQGYREAVGCRRTGSGSGGGQATGMQQADQAGVQMLVGLAR
jgi:hypothetical protein